MSRIPELAWVALGCAVLLTLPWLASRRAPHASEPSAPAPEIEPAGVREPARASNGRAARALASAVAPLAPEVELSAAPDGAPGAGPADAAAGLEILFRLRNAPLVPVAGVYCRVRTSAGRLLSARSDETGRVEFAGLPGGRLQVETTFEEARRVGLPAGRRSRLELRVPEALFAAGRVLTPEGRPVAGADILLCLPSDARSALPLTTTDEQGRFQLDSFHSRAHVFARARGYARSPALFVDETRATRELVLRLMPARDYAGVVRDDQGRPVADAEVLVGSGIQLHGPDVDGLSTGMFPTLWEGRTDDDGTFRIPDVHVDDALPLTVVARGFATLWVEAPRDPASMVLQLVPEFPVAGRVLDAGGGAVSEALVKLDEGPTLCRPATWTDGDGRFVLPGIAEAPLLRLRVVHPDFQPRSLELAHAVVRSGVEIVLRR